MEAKVVFGFRGEFGGGRELVGRFLGRLGVVGYFREI